MKSFYRRLRNNAVLICLLLFLVTFYAYRIGKSEISVLQCNSKNESACVIKYCSKTKLKNRQVQEIEALMNDIAGALDYYSPNSEISLFNHHYDSEPFHYLTPYFYPLLTKIKSIHDYTKGDFDPTVAPYIVLWEAHQKEHSAPSQEAIWAISPTVSLDYMVVNKTRVKKLKEEVTININNLIPGLQTDNIANYVQEKGIDNFCIQIEDTVVAYGMSSKKKHWRIEKKIAHPDLTKPLKIKIDLGDSAIIMLDNSNTLRNDRAEKISCIDPFTGYKVPQHFIAAFVFARDGVSARSYATAFMVKNFTNGLEISEQIRKTGERLEFIVIERDEATEGGIKYNHSGGLEVAYKEGSTKFYIKNIGNATQATPDDKKQ